MQPQPPFKTVDAEYRFDRPKVYLATHELARLTVLRSRLGDTHAERLARAAGFVRNCDLDADRF